MTKTAIVGVLVLACLGLTCTASADEGRVPIYKPTTISEPGSYVVTRSFTATAGVPPITIQASPVNIDLNGMTLGTTEGDGAVVLIAAGAREVTIANGTISDGMIRSFESTQISLILKNLTIQHSQGTSPLIGVQVSACRYFEVSGCRVNTGLISIQPGIGLPMIGRLTNNTIDAPNQITFAIRGSLISGNLISSATAGASLSVAGSANIIENNFISGGDTGLSLGSGSGNVVRGNQFIGGLITGISVSSGGNVITENTVSGYFSSGVQVAGSNNLIEGNNLGGNNNCGIAFGNSNGHAYRNNMLRGNQSAVCGSANTDAGGNIF